MAPRTLGARDYGCMVAYALLILSWFLPLLTNGRVISGGDQDIAQEWLWKRTFLQDSLRAGQIPVMNPFIHGGIPFLATNQSGIFYPFNWLHAVLPLSGVINFQIIVHFWGGLAAMHLLLRRLGRSAAASALGALGFGFSGFAHLHTWAGHIVFIMAWPWAPLAILAWAAVAGRTAQSAPWPACLSAALGLATAMALQFYSGHPQIAYYTVVMLALLHLCWGSYGWAVAGTRCGGAWWRATLWCLLAGVVLGALVAVQLLPTALFSRGSYRHVGPQYEFLYAFGLLPSDAVLLVHPWVWGMFGNFFSPWSQWETVPYVGGVACFLVLVFLFTRRRAGLGWAMLAVALFGYTVGLGPAGGGWYALMLKWLPGLSNFRVPARMRFLGTLALPVVAALGLDGLRMAAQTITLPARRRVFALWRILSAAAILGALAAAAWIVIAGEDGGSVLYSLRKARFPEASWRDYQPQTLRATTGWIRLCAVELLFVVGTTAVALVVACADDRRFARIGAAVVPLLLAAELSYHLAPTRASFRPDQLQLPESVAKTITTDPRYRYGAARLNTDLNQGMSLRARNPSGIEAMMDARWTIVLNRSQRVPHDQYHQSLHVRRGSGFTQALGVRWLLTLSEDTGPGRPGSGNWHLIGLQPKPKNPPPVGDISDPGWAFWEDGEAIPRGYLAYNVRRAANYGEAMALVTAPDFDAHRVAVLNAPDDRPTIEDAAKRGPLLRMWRGWNYPNPAARVTTDTVRFVQDTPELVSMDVATSEACTLVLMDSLHPGWTATVSKTDGAGRVVTPDAPVLLQLANAAGMAVQLDSAGNYRVTLKYESPGLRVGAILSMIGWVSVLILAWWVRQKKLRPQL